MTAAAAGGKRLAPLRWGPRPLPQASFHPGKRARTARMASYLALFFSMTLVACAAIGFALAQRADETLAAEGHAALRAALEELRPSLADPDRPDPGELPLFERRAGLKDLQFDANPRAEPGREEQSLHDDEGRIVGWFSWKADRGFAAVMERLWMLVALVGVALAVFAGLAARAARKLTDALAGSLDTVRKLTGEDALTGLPNQRSMLEHLNVAVAGSTPGFLALALIDLDAFREVNDTLGRTGGDRVIANVAEHLQAGLPAGAQLGRFEDDEFAVFLRGDDPDTATRLVDALRTALLRPIFMERVWQITAGIGVVQAPEDGTTGEELARRAGLALSVAKREGRGAVRRFEPQIEVEYTDRHFLLRELESAISLQALDVHYQPIVAADGGAIVGVEALLRWTHATRGAIEPSVFIPLAEQSGLMSRLGEIVLRRALADGARWPRISVCVNLSPVQIRDRWLIELVSAVMAETGIAPSRVVLEVTEGILIDNPQEALARLEALRALGASIALDDFGTGYSSLSYLQKFPFERLKIDRTFVASLGTTANSGAIIQSIVTLGHALGMSVLAEGVETDEQRVLVRLAGCDEMQGFLFASPCPAAEIDRALAGVAVAVRPSTGPAAASVR